jgi:hypothetical protein
MIALLLLGLMIPPGLANSPTYAQTTYAQGNREEGYWANAWRRLTGRPSRNARSGSTSRGGANHDRCLYTTEELVALVPVSAETGIPYLEPILSGHPTWWFYIPYAGNGRLEAEFVLIDAEERVIYEQKSLVPNTPGLVEVVWPMTNPPLTQGQSYRWVFSILCNPSNRSGDNTVNGWIQRVTDEEESALMANLGATQSPYLFFADALYWFDFLKEVHNLKTLDPEQFDPLWQALLCQVYSQSDRLTRQIEGCRDISTLALPEPI